MHAIEERHRAYTEHPESRRDPTALEELDVGQMTEDSEDGQRDRPETLLEKASREPSSVRTINLDGRPRERERETHCTKRRTLPPLL
eukprot:4365586-Amphidinium_carterae.1